MTTCLPHLPALEMLHIACAGETVPAKSLGPGNPQTGSWRSPLIVRGALRSVTTLGQSWRQSLTSGQR